jgi:hypothetical protein
MKRITILLLLSISPCLPIQGGEAGRPNLVGLKGVVVQVVPTKQDVLPAEALRAAVELRLRQTGINVGTDEDLDGPIFPPVLALSISTLRNSCGISYAVGMHLAQYVDAPLGPERRILVTVWEHVEFGLSGPDAARIRQAIAQCADEFTNDWLAVNPKR